MKGKDERKKNPQWGVKSGITTVPRRAKQIYKSPQRDALKAIMSRQWRIRGWSLDELTDAVMRPDSGYKVKAEASRQSVKKGLSADLTRLGDNRFAQVVKKSGGRWRLKPPAELKSLSFKCKLASNGNRGSQ